MSKLNQEAPWSVGDEFVLYDPNCIYRVTQTKTDQNGKVMVYIISFRKNTGEKICDHSWYVPDHSWVRIKIMWKPEPKGFAAFQKRIAA